MAKIFYWVIPFYLTSFVTSMAADAFFGALLFLLFTIDFTSDIKKIGFKNAAKNLPIGADKPVLFFGFWALLATYIVFGSFFEVQNTFGNVTWIFLLYGISYLFKKYMTLNIKKHFNFIMIIAAIVGFYGIVQMFTRIDLWRPTNEHISPIGDYYRATGFFHIALTYAYCVGMVGFFAFAKVLLQMKQKNNYILPFITSITTVGAIVASSTRGAWIALFVAGLLITFLVNKRKAIVHSLLSVFLIGSLMLVPTIKDRAISIFNMSSMASNTERIGLWKANFEMFKDHPILGVGLERSRKRLPEYYEKLNIKNGFDAHAHNDFLAILSGVGLPGALAFVWFCFYFVRLSYRLFKKSENEDLKVLALGALGAQIYFFVGGITQCNFSDSEVTHVLIFIWALLIGINFNLSKFQKLKN